MTLILHGETVQITAITCANRGNFTEYYASYEHDGTTMPGKIKFRENVAKAFQDAEHTQVKYTRSHIIEVANIDAVIATKETTNGFVYEITHVYASNGDVVEVTTHQNSKPMPSFSLAETDIQRYIETVLCRDIAPIKLSLKLRMFGTVASINKFTYCAGQPSALKAKGQPFAHNTTQKQVA